MKKWVEGVRLSGDNEYLWNSGRMLGDWLATDAEDGSWNGGSDQYFIASAFYANSVNLLAKSMRAIGENAEEYEELYRNIVREFKKTYSEPKTQTEGALALVYDLTDDKADTVKKLAGLIEENPIHKAAAIQSVGAVGPRGGAACRCDLPQLAPPDVPADHKGFSSPKIIHLADKRTGGAYHRLALR